MRTRETSAAHNVWAVERRKARGLLAFLWRVVDALDHVLTLARLRILEALAGPLPETPANQQRARNREQDRDRTERVGPVTSRAPWSPFVPIASARRTGAARGGR
jgi:hypothetical protein